MLQVRMIQIEDFVQCVRNCIVPPGPPERTENYNFHPYYDYYHPLIDARLECINYGMWTIVDKNWTKILADWIEGRKCLEIMAGAGWLSYALSGFGTKCTATDDFSWDEKHDKMIRVFLDE